ncbi:MAG: hypothetical protein AAF567_20225 [Actinomycetota bacterium]
MAADLERLIRSIEGDRPSPEFVADLRERLIQETLAKIDDAPNIDVEPTPDIGHGSDRSDSGADPGPEGSVSPRSFGHGWLLATAAAVVLVVGLLVVTTTGRDERVDTIGPVSEPTAALASPSVLPTPTVAAIVATPLRSQDNFIEEGRYRVDDLGTAIEFDTSSPLWLVEGTPGQVTIAHPNGRGGDDRILVMMRVSALSDPTDLGQPFGSVDGGFAAADFAGWLDELPDGLLVTDRRVTTVGGRTALRADLALGDQPCGAGLECAYFATNRLVATRGLRRGSSYRIWMVDQGEQAPLALIAAYRGDAQADWLEVVDDLVATIGLGEVVANPVTLLSPGRSELPVSDGVSIELAEPAALARDTRGFDRVMVDGLAFGIDFLDRPLDRFGASIESTEALVDALVAIPGVDMTPVAATQVDGLQAQAFRFVNVSGSIAAELKSDPGASVGWQLPSSGRLWAIEHPDRGLLIVATGGDPTRENEVAEAIEQAALVVESLRFTG